MVNMGNNHLKRSILSNYIKTNNTDNICEFCRKSKPDVKLRKLYDYINCEDDWVTCCSQCEGSFWENL